MKKIGIYPGAFDPVHYGHLAFAVAVQRKHQLDRVFFLPEPQPRHKQAVKSLEHRIAMVQIAIQADETLGVIALEQARFTVHDTWPLITARFKGAQLYMLLGSDVVQRLASWPDIAELIQDAPHFEIAMRGANKADVQEVITTLEQTKKQSLLYDILDPDYATYSSRAIRLALKKGELPDGLDPEVASYIKRHGLYTSGPA